MINKKQYQALITPTVQWTQATLTDTYGECIAAPLEPGFGVTFGNALRRILLGGIEGSAVTSVIIKGVNNEFSALFGVYEDTLTILLNIKQLVIKNKTGAPGSMKLEFSGPGQAKASSIKCDDHLEIVNKEHIIATLAQDGHIEIEFFVESGRGYQPAAWPLEKSLQENGKMYLDATFAPVSNVTFEVQKTRIGKNIDYDKLVLTIFTNGSESPVEVLSYASSVVRNQIASFLLAEEISFPVHQAQVARVLPSVAQKEVSLEAISEQAAPHAFRPTIDFPVDLFLKPIDVLGLPARAHNCLISADINRVIELVNMTEQQVVTIKNFGKKSYEDLIQIMKEFNLSFDMRVNEKEIIDLLGNSHESSKR